MAMNIVGIALSWAAITISLPLLMGGFGFDSIEAAKAGVILLIVGTINIGVMRVLSRSTSTVVSTGLVVVAVGAIIYLRRPPKKLHR